MRTRTKSITAALVILSLVSGAVGCKSNGGPWYKPNSYTFHSPFSGKDAGESEGAALANSKPSLDSHPNVNVPPGGYTSKEDEAKFYAGKQDGSKSVVPQYGTTNFGTADNKVASTQNLPNLSANAYLPAETPYSPYGQVEAPASYQPTSYYDTAPPTQQPPAYPGTGIQGGNPAPYQPQPVTPSYSPAGTVPQNNNYSPYSPAPAGTQPAAAPGVPAYGQPATTNNYGVPTATPNNPNPVPTGFTATPSAYSANPGGF